jgi:hypothetical protein
MKHLLTHKFQGRSYRKALYAHIFSPKNVLLMKNEKQRITYLNYVCFMFIVLMTSFHKLTDCMELIFLNISSKVLTLSLGLEPDIFTLQANSPTVDGQ